MFGSLLRRLVLTYFVFDWPEALGRDFFSRCASDNRRTESFLVWTTRAGTSNIVFCFFARSLFVWFFFLFRSRIFPLILFYGDFLRVGDRDANTKNMPNEVNPTSADTLKQGLATFHFRRHT